ncbi:MAG: BamA/TamA family outer membrane protein [Gammaproteobacteria bacterium]|nr:BamA/TamA family outer membrane protein [Gammaproteobacteria bacterium]
MTRLKTASLLLCIVGALAAGVPARADIDIDISGVDGALRRNVLAFLSLERYKGRDDLDQALVERLQERAEREAANALRPFGYYQPQINSTVEATGEGRWRARIRIDPGPPVILGDVELGVSGPGSDDPAFREVLGGANLRKGARLDHAAYDTLKDNLRRTAATLGYVDAQLQANELRVDPAQRSANIRLVMSTGERYRFGSTTIDQRSLEESLLRRYLRYQEATPYDARQLLRTQFALDDSQYFSTVEVLAGEPDHAARLIPVSIRAEPNRRNRYSAGLGYATDSKARGTLTWENRRLNDAGHRLRAELKAAQLEQSFAARYQVPIGDPALERLGFEFRYARDELGDLDTRTTRFQPSITQVDGEWQRVVFASLSRVRTITAAAPNRPGFEDATTLIIPGISYASVPRGYLGEALFSRALYAELRGSATALGATENYLQLRVEAERVFDLAPAWHLFLRGQVGATLVSNAAALPGTERFFAGGDRSVRGFGYNDLSPVEGGSTKIGGRHLLTGTVEVIRDLPRNLGAALFFDAGNAFDSFGDPLQYSIGIGVRLRLPIVTLGVDIAQPLTNPVCRSVTPDPRCNLEAGFDRRPGPRLHLNFSPKL